MPTPTKSPTPAAPTANREAQRLRVKLQELFRETESIRRALTERNSKIGANSVTISPVGLAARSLRDPDAKALSATTSWWPTRVLPQKSLVPPPGLGALSLPREQNAVVGFIVVGMGAETLERMVQLVSVSQRARMNFIPIFFSSSTDFSSFRRRGYVLEYVTADDVDGGGDRLRYLERKWGVQSTIDLRDASDGSTL